MNAWLAGSMTPADWLVSILVGCAAAAAVQLVAGWSRRRRERRRRKHGIEFRVVTSTGEIFRADCGMLGLAYTYGARPDETELPHLGITRKGMPTMTEGVRSADGWLTLLTLPTPAGLAIFAVKPCEILAD